MHRPVAYEKIVENAISSRLDQHHGASSFRQKLKMAQFFIQFYRLTRPKAKPS
jgi:hypothetical protein